MFYYQAVSGSTVARAENEFYKHTWNLGPERGPQVLPAGNHVWHFELLIPGDMPESIEGVSSSWVVYQMKATIGRSVLYKDLVARKHMRIIRTFDPGTSELSQSACVANAWPPRLNYEVATPTKGVIFGTSIPLNFRLLPLRKGMRIGKIESELKEKWHLKVRSSSQPNRDYHMEKLIVSDAYEPPEDVPLEDVDGAEGWRITRELAVPRNLKSCRQSVEGTHIQISHNVHFTFQIINPDGRPSQVSGQMPVHVFIAPDLRIDGEHELLNPGAPLADTYNDGGLVAPPGYGAHTLDALYSGVDPADYMTPAPSAPATPLGALSRSGSYDDVASLAPVDRQLSANTLHNRLLGLDDATVRAAQDEAAARRAQRDSSSTSLSTLSRRLQQRDSSSPSLSTAALLRRGNASATDVTSPPGRPADHVAPPATNRDGGSGSGSGSGLHHARRASHEPGAALARNFSGLFMSAAASRGRGSLPPPPAAARPNLSAETLSKVPSYQTAVNSPAPVGDRSVGLPSYESATSRPASPPMLPPPPSTTRRSPPARSSPPMRRAPQERQNSGGGRRVRYVEGTSGG